MKRTTLTNGYQVLHLMQDKGEFWIDGIAQVRAIPDKVLRAYQNSVPCIVLTDTNSVKVCTEIDEIVFRCTYPLGVKVTGLTFNALTNIVAATTDRLRTLADELGCSGLVGKKEVHVPNTGDKVRLLRDIPGVGVAGSIHKVDYLPHAGGCAVKTPLKNEFPYRYAAGEMYYLLRGNEAAFEVIDDPKKMIGKLVKWKNTKRLLGKVVAYGNGHFSVNSPELEAAPAIDSVEEFIVLEEYSGLHWDEPVQLVWLHFPGATNIATKPYFVPAKLTGKLKVGDTVRVAHSAGVNAYESNAEIVRFTEDHLLRVINADYLPVFEKVQMVRIAFCRNSQGDLFVCLIDDSDKTEYETDTFVVIKHKDATKTWYLKVDEIRTVPFSESFGAQLNGFQVIGLG